jgi:hypothetical protein
VLAFVGETDKEGGLAKRSASGGEASHIKSGV